MLRICVLILCLFPTAQFPALAVSLVIVNSASYSSALVPETIATGYGSDLATASGTGTTVTIKDSGGTTRSAFLVMPFLNKLLS